MKKHILSLIIACVCLFPLYAEIIESSSVTVVLDYLQPNSLIAWDIDNTLARTPDVLGSDEWFCFSVNEKIAMGMEYIDAVNATLPLAYYAHFNIPLVPTETLLPKLFSQLRALNVYTMGLTARGPYLAERTHEQLDAIDIIFNMGELNLTHFIIPAEKPCLYMYDIIFTGNNDKGLALAEFFRITNYKPAHLIFIDDKMYHLKSVEKIANQLGISYTGIRYSGCDKYIEEFDPIKADLLLQTLRAQNKLKTQKIVEQYRTRSTKTTFWDYPLYVIKSLFSYVSL